MQSTLPTLPTPHELGLPDKFSSWRPQQEDCISRICNDSGNQAYSIPTGGGKSPAYVAAALIAGARTRILTSTKQLQRQLLDDFGSIGMVEIKGKSNYPCRQHGNCDEGHDAECSYRQDGDKCPYRRALAEADRSQLVVTNYAWQCHNAVSGGLNRMEQPDLLILDEAHDSMNAVTDALTVEIHPADMELTGKPPAGTQSGRMPSAWAAWIKTAMEAVTAAAGRIKAVDSAAVKQKTKLRRLYRRLQIAALATTDWVYQWKTHYSSGGRYLVISPLWPMDSARRLLSAPRVIAMSATLTLKSLELIGWQPGQFTLAEYPSSFDPQRSPVYWLKTAKLGNKMKPEDTARWVDTIDSINTARQDRKGIIHTVSFDRGKLIARSCKTAGWFHRPESGRDTAVTVAEFRRAKPPAVLISPSVSTGWDFPMESCEYQIIAKLPFADLTDFLVRSRMESDPDWYAYQTIMTLVQMCGRGMRGPTDRCETWIIDDQIAFMLARHRHHFPQWWLKQYSKRTAICRAPPLIGSNGKGNGNGNDSTAVTTSTATSLPKLVKSPPADDWDPDIPF